jgi:hypothetical protein
MGFEQFLPEEHVRARAYAIWEADGRQHGRSDEYWLRALEELQFEMERAWLMALEARENSEFVMPRLPISARPSRHEAGRLNADALREAA